MCRENSWREVDGLLARHAPLFAHLPAPADVATKRQAEQEAFVKNLPILIELLLPWRKGLEDRDFIVSCYAASADRLCLKYHRHGYQGTGGFGSWHDAFGNLVAAWVTLRADASSLSWHTDPDQNTHLGERFAPGEFQTFLQRNLLTYLDDGNLLLDTLASRRWRETCLGELREQFEGLKSTSNRQAAGLEFEKLLERLFATEGLAPRGSFRVVGEQIDGAFLLDHETYLVEAKWEKEPLDVKELYGFREKIEGKSAHTRGVFVAINGITKNAGVALVSGKQPLFFVVIGREIDRILEGDTSLTKLLRNRQKLFAEQGAILDPQLE